MGDPIELAAINGIMWTFDVNQGVGVAKNPVPKSEKAIAAAVEMEAGGRRGARAVLHGGRDDCQR